MHGVQTLVLDDNAISDWRSLRPLYHMSNLRCLSLSDNRINSVPADELSEGMHPIAAYDSALCITHTCFERCADGCSARHHQRRNLTIKPLSDLTAVKLVQGRSSHS